MIEQPWIGEWIATPAGFEIPPDGVKLIRANAEAAWARPLLIRFPPWCLVRSLRDDLLVPAQGTLGVVVAHGRPTHGTPGGTIFVQQHPEARLRAPCDADALEVVHYVRGIEPHVVARIIGEACA